MITKIMLQPAKLSIKELEFEMESIQKIKIMSELLFFSAQSIEENEVYLPNDELWIYETDNGLW